MLLAQKGLLTSYDGLQAQRQVLELQQLDRVNKQRIHTGEATNQALRREVNVMQYLI